MKKFAVIFLILVYGCSYYLYGQEVKDAAQNMFDRNFNKPIKVTGASFNPLAPICLDDKTIISFTSEKGSGNVPMNVTRCALTPRLEVEMPAIYVISFELNGF